MTGDTGRGGGQAPRELAERFSVMLDRLTTGRLWADEYAEFVRNVSFAGADAKITYPAALEAVRRLVHV